MRQKDSKLWPRTAEAFPGGMATELSGGWSDGVWGTFQHGTVTQLLVASCCPCYELPEVMP